MSASTDDRVARPTGKLAALGKKTVEVVHDHGRFGVVTIFFLGLLVPLLIPVGPFLLTAHRTVLLVMFLPLVAALLAGKAGKIILPDYLMGFSALWAALTLAVNHGLASEIEGMGIHVLEFFGGYLVGRVGLRNAQEFQRFVKLFFLVGLILVPLAFFEAQMRRNFILDALPRSLGAVDTGIRMGMRRAQVVFAHPIIFGSFMATSFGLFFFALAPQAGMVGRALRSSLAIAGTFFSLSSGALISLTIQFCFVTWELLLRAVKRRWTVFGWMVVIGYFVVDALSNRTPFHVLVDYASFNTGSAYNRIRIWNFGTANIRENPLFGLGMGDWDRPSWMSGSVDNFWLVIAMRYGLPAGLTFMLAVVLIIRGVARADYTDPLHRGCQAGFLVAVGGACVAGGTVHYWHAAMAYMLFLFGSGVWLIRPPGVPETPTTDTQDGPDPAQDPASRYTRMPLRTPQRFEKGATPARQTQRITRRDRPS